MWRRQRSRHQQKVEPMLRHFSPLQTRRMVLQQNSQDGELLSARLSVPAAVAFAAAQHCRVLGNYLILD
jgi:hypothetical protein